MPTHPASDETVGVTLDAGIALALRADDSGDWKAVADWLAGHPQHAAGLAEFLAAQRGLRSAVAPLRGTSDRVGGSLGEFELTGELGRGGMGVVYRAFDTKLKREVAVKLLRSGEAFSAVEVARFRYEAELVASLHHPNIVPVHSFGETDSGPYLVMPLMTGGSLAAWLKGLGADRRLNPKRAADLVRAVARGVHHAHEQGLIHRDLKPGNVLLDAHGLPHVADFGLARRVDATTSTAAGIAGTVAYMAPEQGRGEKQLTTAVDVYALGVILFELLAGSVPYAGSDVAGILLRLTDTTEPVPPVSQLRPDVPPDLAAICAKCLEKRPEDRYASAQELADALERFLNGEPQLDCGTRGWLYGVRHAMAWRREVASLRSWWSLFFGAASATLALAAIQLVVLLEASAWVGMSAMAYYLVAWLLIARWVQLRGRGSLTAVERFATAQQYGMMLACAAVVPWHLPLTGEVLAGVFQAFLVVVGVAIFSSGAIFWGRMYVAGLLHIGLAACFPLIPVRYWPGVYGLTSILFQAWAAVNLRRIHRDALLTQARAAG